MRSKASAMQARAVLAITILATLAACGSVGVEALSPLRISASSAAMPWIGSAYDCAPRGTAIVLAGETEADVILRLAEPKPLTIPAYQVGEDDLLVVTHPQAAVGTLSSAQVESIFAGQIENWSEVGGADQPVQVWVFAPTVDVQWYFDRMVLKGRPVSSRARLAVSAQHMADSVGAVAGSIGLLTRRWKSGNTREVLLVSSIPVLALTPKAPGREGAEFIACMQGVQ